MAGDDSNPLPMRTTESDLATLAARLEALYPGVRCRVRWTDLRPDPARSLEGHALWTVSFFAHDTATLIRHGLATAEQFEVDETQSSSAADRHPCFKDGMGDRMAVAVWPNKGGEVFEVRTLVMDYQNPEERFTKKLQAEVARYLRPFIRGTWKPRQTA